MLKTRCECGLAKSTECKQCHGTGWCYVKDDSQKWAIVAAAVIALLVIGAMLGHAHWIYGDWTCALAECRKVTP